MLVVKYKKCRRLSYYQTHSRGNLRYFAPYQTNFFLGFLAFSDSIFFQTRRKKGAARFQRLVLLGGGL